MYIIRLLPPRPIQVEGSSLTFGTMKKAANLNIRAITSAVPTARMTAAPPPIAPATTDMELPVM